MGAKLVKKSEVQNNFGKKLQKRNKFKYFGYHLAGMLYYQNPNSLLAKGYRNTLYCCNIIEVTTEGLAKGKYCKNRWCPICQRNKMGALINAYGERLRMEKELWFLTLTRPNVTAEKLKTEVTCYQELWRQIANSREYRKAMREGVIGMRKLECTYHGRQFLKDGTTDPWWNTYHPHFHLLLSSKELANFILFLWLQLNSESNEDAQDCRKVEGEGSFLEIFKYFTKLIAKDSEGRRFFDAVHMNTIFEALQGRRVYFRLGTKKAWGCDEVTEEDEDQVATIETDATPSFYGWQEFENEFGYYDIETGEVLTELPKEGNLYDIVIDSEQRIRSPNI